MILILKMHRNNHEQLVELSGVSRGEKAAHIHVRRVRLVGSGLRRPVSRSVRTVRRNLCVDYVANNSA